MYKTIVLLGRQADGDSQVSDEFYLAQYLKEDLRLLQDYELLAVQQVAPMLFKYSPEICVGNKDIIQLIVSSLLPDKVNLLECLVWDIHEM